MNIFQGIKNKIKDTYLDAELAEKEKLLIQKYKALEDELELAYDMRLKEQVEAIEQRFVEETNEKLLVVCKEYQRFFNEKIDQIDKVFSQVNFQAEQFNVFLQIQIDQIQTRVEECARQEQAQQIRKEFLFQLRNLYQKEPKDSFLKKIFISKTDISKNIEQIDATLREISKHQVDSILKVQQRVSVDQFFKLECNLLKDIRKLYIEDKNMETIKNNYVKTFECCVCLEKSKAQYVWSSCGHTNTCIKCSASLKACPICRKPGKLIHLYF